MRALFPFTVSNRYYFESLAAYPSTPAYADILRRHLSSGWTIERSDLWLYARPLHYTPPAQGFKLHVSAIPSNAEAILEAVVPECCSAGVSFKIVAGSNLLGLICSKNYGRGSSGKFITIYPPTEEAFKCLAERLREKTDQFQGPYILSDRRYKDSKVVFYRYGGLLRNYSLRIDGQRTPVIRGPDGTLESDERLPYFKLPVWVGDPFGDSGEPAADGEAHLLNGRYSIQEALNFSNAGGVYKALDTQTGKSVVIKEARPLTAYWAENGEYMDAVRALQREHHILQKLAGLSFIPVVVDLFWEWEHLFLVEEFVAKLPLTRLRASLDFTLAPYIRDQQRTQNFCRKFRKLATALLDAVEDIHRRNILIGDLSPNNVLVDRETLELHLIDFEGAQDLDDAEGDDHFSVKWATPGFASAERRHRSRLSRSDDYYGLGMSLYSLLLPVQTLFELYPPAQRAFAPSVSEAMGLPSPIQEAVYALLENRPEHARYLLSQLEMAKQNEQPDGMEQVAEQWRNDQDKADLCQTVEGVKNFLLHTYDLSRSDRLWPTDFLTFVTNPLSVAYGACGTILCLKEIGERVPEELINWLSQRQQDLSLLPPGLWVGAAGLAWTLADLGDLEKSCEIMTRVYASPLLKTDATFIHGIAGWGLASLRIYKASEDRSFLNKAIEAGEHLLATGQRTPLGCFWKTSLDDLTHSGLAYGPSGIALFLLHLYRISGQARFLELATSAIDFEVAQGGDGEQLRWGRFAGDQLEEPYWIYGAAGIGAVLIRFFALLGDTKYLGLARRAANAAYARFTVLPSQFEGLSGIGELMLDMFLNTGEEEYLRKSYDIAKSVLNYRIETPEGVAFPGRYLLRISNDHAYGSAGVASFLHRLIAPGLRRFHDL